MARRFPDTRRSVIAAASAPTGTGATRARGVLYRMYRQPILSLVKRQGVRDPDAQDLTQDALLRLFARDQLARLAGRLTSFRGWLAAAVKHLVHNHRRFARARKRGGGVLPCALAPGADSARIPRQLVHDHGPARAYDRQRALAILGRVMAEVERAEHAAGRGAAFRALSPYMDGSPVPREIAHVLGVSWGALHKRLYDLRARHRRALCDYLTECGARESTLDHEIALLFSAL